MKRHVNKVEGQKGPQQPSGRHPRHELERDRMDGHVDGWMVKETRQAGRVGSVRLQYLLLGPLCVHVGLLREGQHHLLLLRRQPRASSGGSRGLGGDRGLGSG